MKKFVAKNHHSKVVSGQHFVCPLTEGGERSINQIKPIVAKPPSPALLNIRLRPNNTKRTHSKQKVGCSSPTGSQYFGGDPICPAGSTGFRVDSSELVFGCKAFNNVLGITGFNIIICTNDFKSFTWSATRPGIVSVTVKGGSGGCAGSPNNQNTCTYNADQIQDTVAFSAPLNSTCDIPNIDFIDFCISPDIVILYGLTTSKTANTRFDRTYNWSIVKSSGGVTDLNLLVGEVVSQPYTVTLSDTHSDSNWQVYGTITVNNTNLNAIIGQNFNITLNSVTDLVPPAAVVTGPSLPLLLMAGQSAVFNYVATLPSATPSSGTNTATTNATYGTATRNFNAQENWDFGNAFVDLIDPCVNVEDDHAGTLGTVCYDDLDKQFNYSLEIGPYGAPGEYQFTNVASFDSLVVGGRVKGGEGKKNQGNSNLPDPFQNLVTAQSGQSSATINIHVSDDQDCTQTAKYWKTHAGHGNDPYDPTWDDLPNGPDTIFFYSGRSYYRVLKKGLHHVKSYFDNKAHFQNKNHNSCRDENPYYILAAQYIAAELNQLAGASIPQEVLDAYNQATVLFDDPMNTPEHVCKKKRLGREFRELACVLEEYNCGEVGPGSC